MGRTASAARPCTLHHRADGRSGGGGGGGGGGGSFKAKGVATKNGAGGGKGGLVAKPVFPLPPAVPQSVKSEPAAK